MVIICFGMQKSASTFVYQMTRDMLEDSGFMQESIRHSYLPLEKHAPYQQLTGKELKYFCSAIPENQLYVIKTHSFLDNDMSNILARHEALAIATYRDPLDVMVSFLDVGVSERSRPLEKQRQAFANIYTIEDTMRMLDNIIPNVESWLRNKFVKNIPYTNIYYDPDLVAKQIKDFLGLNVNAKSICNRYTSNKASIGEYNKGGVGRYKGVISEDILNVARQQYESFREEFILLPGSK